MLVSDSKGRGASIFCRFSHERAIIGGPHPLLLHSMGSFALSSRLAKLDTPIGGVYNTHNMNSREIIKRLQDDG